MKNKYQFLLQLPHLTIVTSLALAAWSLPTRADVSADGMQSRTGVIQLTPFSDTEIDEGKMRAGIRALFANSAQCQSHPDGCIDENQVQAALARAKHFKKFMQDVVRRKLADGSGGKIQFEDRWTTHDSGEREYHVLKFPSLIVRPNGHPSNLITAGYVVPSTGKCMVDYKTVIFLHGATEDTFNGTATLAKDIAAINNVATLAMYLPQFGSRRILPNGKLDAPKTHTKYDPEEFNMDYLDITDKDAIDLNIAQTMLDIHLAIDLVNSMKHTSEPSTVALDGLSLGSVIALLYEGVEPGRVTGGDGLYAPGGDIAHAIGSVIASPLYKDDYFVNFAKSIDWQVDRERPKFAEFDPITWSGQIQNRKFFFINADYDDTFVPKFSYDPLVQQFNSNNQFVIQSIATAHNPGDSGVLYLAIHLFFPIMNYARSHGVTADPNHCLQQQD